MAAATPQTIFMDPLTRPPASPTSPTSQPTSPGPNITADATASPGQSVATSAHVSSADSSPVHQDSIGQTTSPPANSAPIVAHSALPQWVANIKQRNFKAKTLFEVTVAIVAIFGVVWATFVSLPSWKLQKWSAGNDFLQACLALEDPAVRSVRCNETIELGPVAPPKWKRDLVEVPASTIARDPLKLAAAVVVTLGALVAAAIYFRPRTEPFHPVVSMAREAVCGPNLNWQRRIGPQRTFTIPTDLAKVIGFSNGGAYSLQTGEHPGAPEPVLGDVYFLTGAKNLDLDECEGADDHPKEADLGQRIGVWYDSDEEDGESVSSRTKSEKRSLFQRLGLESGGSAWNQYLEGREQCEFSEWIPRRSSSPLPSKSIYI